MKRRKQRRHALFIPNQTSDGDLQNSPSTVNYGRRKKARASIRQKRQKNVSRETKETPTSFSDFETVTETPFDTNFDVENVIPKTVEDMKVRFNLTSDDKRRATFGEKHGIFGDDYDVITSILGSDLYRQLRDLGYIDSNQIIDLQQEFRGDITSQDIELALLKLIKNVNNEYTRNVQKIQEAMDMGFSFDEATYLLENDLDTDYEFSKGLTNLRDYVSEQLENSETRDALISELRENIR